MTTAKQQGLLVFGDMRDNKKLSKRLPMVAWERGYRGRYLTFGLPSGYTCPGAGRCLAYAHPETGRITDGRNKRFRCYAASVESYSKAKRDNCWHNYRLLLDTDNRYDLIRRSLTFHGAGDNGSVIRLHDNGDFFDRDYFDAWVAIAEESPSDLFYGYTKSLHFVVNRTLPDNLRLAASTDGKYDHLIDLYNLRSATVLFMGDDSLPIDDDDVTAAFGSQSFGLRLHGTQPKGLDTSQG